MKYHLWIDGKGQGPYDKTQIAGMLATGKISKQTRCLPWDGHEGCHVVGMIPGLGDEGNPPRPVRPLLNRKGVGIVFTIVGVLIFVLLAVNLRPAAHRRTPTKEREVKRMEAQVDWYRDSAKLNAEAVEVLGLAQVAVSYLPMATYQERTNVIWAVANATNVNLQANMAAGFRQLDEIRAVLKKFIAEKEAIRARAQSNHSR